MAVEIWMRQLAQGLVFCTGVGLAVLGSTVLWTVHAAGLVLDSPDPLMPLSSRFILYLIGGGSLLLSVYLLAGGTRQIFLKLCLLAWFSGNLCLYEVASQWYGNANFLDCLGNLNDRIPIPPKILAPALLAVFLVLFAGDILAILLLKLARWKTGRRGLKEFNTRPEPISC